MIFFYILANYDISFENFFFIATLLNWIIEHFLFFFQWRPQAIVFGIVTNKKFDMIIMMFIGLNMLTMTLDHYGQSEMWVFALENLNMGFICIFTTECVLKIFALRQHYFTEPWNIFDFVVVILSILGKYTTVRTLITLHNLTNISWF